MYNRSYKTGDSVKRELLSIDTREGERPFDLCFRIYMAYYIETMARRKLALKMTSEQGRRRGISRIACIKTNGRVKK